MSAQTPTINWESATFTHRGKVRDHNEDAYLDNPHQRIWAVADGMGGHHAGDVASRNVVNALAGIQAGESLSRLIQDCRQRLQTANAELFHQGLRQNAKIIGSTVVAMLSSKNQGAFLWAGDSRAYRLRGNDLEQLTQDHSRVTELIQLGQLTPAEAESHPEANVITRAIGVSDQLELDVRLFDIELADTFLICSDGLSRYLSPAQLIEHLSLPTCEQVGEALMQAALNTTARDNITLVVVRAQRGDASTTTQLNPQTPGGPSEDEDPTLLDTRRRDE